MQAFNILFEDYRFLKFLFDTIEYSFDHLLNNKDIFLKIIEHKICVLNAHQKQFIISNRFILDKFASFLNYTINCTLNKNTKNEININNSDIHNKAIKNDDKEYLNKILSEKINSLEKINVYLLKDIEALKYIKITDDLRN